MDPNNKVILIVGASSGIGRAIARQLAEQGAKLAVTARREDKLLSLKTDIENAGGTCLVLPGDALNHEHSQEIVRRTVKTFGKLDAIFLNAGGAPALDMRKMTATEVNHYMRSNYDVCVNVLFPALEQMKQQRSGLVVTTNSLAGFLGVPLQGPYSAAKGALKLLIDTCRLEFHEFGIRFVSTYPGFVATEATRDDGMPAPLEISEDKAAAHIITAMRKEKPDYLFPAVMRWLIRLALVLPAPIVRWILRQDVPKHS